MTTSATGRQPSAEWGLLALGACGFGIAFLFKLSGLLVAAILLCIAAAISIGVTAVLSKRGLAINAVATALGAAACVFGFLWWVNYRDEPEIFSPIFVGYLGGGVLLSGTLNLVHSVQRRR